ncbi:MAG: beta-N-acetylhexosaminidase, partial [Prevotella sp.]|nr:beta-N-acetylhexosaminidase [Prevotella sp.]
MKKIVKIQAILLFLLGLTLQAPAQSVNLTPWPKTMTTKSGEFVLPQTITIDVSELSDDVVAEANDFAATLRAATGRSVTVGNAENAAIKLQMNASTLDEEGYILVVAEDGITLKASTVKGFFYGLQSIKKMLPGNVLVEKLDASATYAIPCVSINDAPRFAYRGFMLDVSRHFFTVEEIKKMLRIMAYYKMNFFHWHLTDDQGWRVEVKKYPKLTTVAATRANSYNTDLKYGQYWTNEQYGPYFYTQDEIRDVVTYAEKLHITVIPEIEMPGHLAAAMTAYPEFSCTPNGSHNVWVSGGISQDVLNVANDRAVQFAKDILTEIAPLFPSEIFHVGGDECPTNA